MMNRVQLLRRGLFVGLALFMVGTVTIAGYTLWRLKAEAIANGLEVAAMHSRTFENFLTQSLHSTELAVVNAVPEGQALDARTLEALFVATLRHTPFLRSISLLDDAGRIVASSNRANLGVTVKTDTYLPRTDGHLEILRMGQPWIGRDFGDGKPSAALVDAQAQSFIPLTRTLNRGGRAVTVLVAFNSDYFVNHVAQALDVTEGWVEVLRYDGVVLMDSSADPQTGVLHDDAVRQLRLAEVEFGRLEEDGTRAGNLLTAFRASPLYPLVVLIHRPRENALTQWHSEAQTLLAGVFFVLLMVGGLALAFYRRQLLVFNQKAEVERLQRINVLEQAQAQEKIAELNRDFVAFLENTSDFIYFKDAHSRFRFCSQTLARITGHAHWRELIGKHDVEVFPKEIAQIYYKEELPIFAEGKPLLNKVAPYVDAAGTPGWVSTNKWPVLDPQGKVVGLFGISRDITDHVAAEKKLKLAASVFANSREAIMITATDGAIVDINDAFTRITGYEKDEVVGKNPRILKSGRQGQEHYVTMWRSLIDKGHWYGEIWNRRKNGEVYAEMQTISSVYDEQGVVQHYVSLFSDITPVKVHQQQLEHIAHFDALTNLPNRVLLADRLRQAMTQALRRGQLLAVVFLDLDGFKRINDNHGHEAGDQLLITVAERMHQALREVDTMARIGGDEFVAVLADLSDAATTVPMITRLLTAAAQSVEFGDTTLQVSASLGVTFYPQADEVDADQLLRQADQAMYQAKLAGKNRYHVFDAEQDRSVRGHHEHLENVRHAVVQREFVLYYQPKVNMRTGQVIGAEALIRWQHPEHGLLLPGAFLPVIEDHPLAVDVGEWVIDSALAQMELWHAAGLMLPVSVNVGARQLQQVDFVARLRNALEARPAIHPSFLELEVLETSALEDMNGVSQVMEACRDMGVSFALDDFGTGYSSLTYLKRLPARWLKIDQSFVCNMLDDPEDLAILEGVVGLASAFSREIIAEGVETIAQGTMLLQLGCDFAQGYGIARPMPAHAIPDWVASWTPDATWGQQTLISRGDLPLLFVSVEHRAWQHALEHYLQGIRETAPELGHGQCHFGNWLQSEGLQRYGELPAFGAVLAVHRQLHDLAAVLCELRAHGRAKEALLRWPELQALSDTLLETIAQLGRERDR